MNSTLSQRKLREALSLNHLSLSSEQEEKILHFLQMIQQWNRVFNLTAITDLSDMIALHIIDSLIIAPFIQGDSILDVGSGGGLPGIPLAIFYPEKKWTLLDSQHKKTRFLTQVTLALALKNVDIITQRVERFHPATLFDTIITRAFAPISKMLALTQHLLQQEGQFLAMKGKYPVDEIEAIPETYNVIATHPLTIQGIDSERHLICLGKK